MQLCHSIGNSCLEKIRTKKVPSSKDEALSELSYTVRIRVVI